MIQAALIGAGIGPSLTPALHEVEARRLGLAYTYHRIDSLARGIGAADLPAVLDELQGRGFVGTNVTHPFKQAVLPLLDALTADAAAIGAVNHIQFGPDGRVGDNTDWLGFRAALAGVPALVGRVVLVGAGGAGSAALYALLRAGCPAVDVLDEDDAAAAGLVERLGSRPGGAVRAMRRVRLEACLAGAAGVVHATPVGMREHPGVAFDVGALDPSTWLVDVVYRPLRTALLQAAAARGLAVMDGGHMAVGQAVESLRRFTGVDPDAARMRRHFEELVAAEEQPGA